MRNPSPKTRKYLYRVANAVLAVAVLKGLLSGEESAAGLLVANAALGLADANVEA